MRPTFRLVPDFIIPHLNRSTYGNHLHWEDKKNGSFKISRIHQSSEMWNEQCIEVYKAWSMKKKLWHADDPKKITKAKHRLITALRRNPEIEMLEKESTFYRFRIVHPDNRLHQDSKGQLKVQAVRRKNTDEIENFSISNDETKSCDIKSILESDKDVNDYCDFTEGNINLFRTATNLWPLPRPDHFDIQMFSVTENIFDDQLNLEETKAPTVTDKCCCEKLLDNYLCNQKCIWHGMPP